MPPFVRGTSTSRAPSQLRGLAFPLRSPAHDRVPPSYRRFLTTTGPAATLWPSALLPAPTLLRRISLRDQEGFASSDATLPCVPSPLPRWVRPRCRPVFRGQYCLRPVEIGSAPRFWKLTRLAQRSIPTARKVAPWPFAKFVRRHRPRLSPAKRLLCFVSLAFLTVGFSPTGLHRLLVTPQRVLTAQESPPSGLCAGRADSGGR